MIFATAGLPVLNTAVTAAVPSKFYCQNRTCESSWAKPGQDNAYWKALENLDLTNCSGSCGDERVGIFPDHHLPTSAMCKVKDCRFLKEGNVGAILRNLFSLNSFYFLCFFFLPPTI